jgi:hypothetical protein
MKRSKFSLSHYKLLTCKMGQLVPVAWFEALPGDTMQASTSALIRCAPLVTPVMHPVSVRFHWWFVPNRLVWANFTKFITGGTDGLDVTAHPTVTHGGVATESGLGDYLGASTTQTGLVYNALPYRAYALIWNEFYRDQDLQSLAPLSTADGADVTTSINATLNICWEKDYLTSARPWVQKGATVTLPLGTTAPVQRVSSAVGPVQLYKTGTNTFAGAGTVQVSGASGHFAENTGGDITLDPGGSLIANLAAASAIDINSVRTAFALQRYQEARARYGSRYVEYLRYLGVRSSDARQQRPEYLGGGKNTIQFSEVLQTGVTTSGTPSGIGTMFGHGITGTRSRRWRRFFEEHGIIMCLMSVRPKTMYSQRIKRAFYRGQLSTAGVYGTKYDYWQKEIESIGQQGIQGGEADASAFSAGTPWGYQDRYDEYRREESSVAGAFRSTLDNWHLSREFGSPPSLNSTFVSCVPTTRVFADTTHDNMYVCCNHNIQARRLLKKEGTSLTF